MIIVQDTREKEPWQLTTFAECEEQIVKTVSTGDYIIKGKETLITIDRKKSPTELANNLGMHIKRFENEMERMQEYTYRYIICEFPYEKLLKFPYGCGLPKFLTKRIRVRGKFLIKQAKRLADKYGVEFIFCASREEAQERAIALFKGALENEKQQDSSKLSEVDG